MEFKYISILISFLIGLVYLMKRMDKYEEEPYIMLLLIIIIGGIIACLTTYLFNSPNHNPPKNKKISDLSLLKYKAGHGT